MCGSKTCKDTTYTCSAEIWGYIKSQPKCICLCRDDKLTVASEKPCAVSMLKFDIYVRRAIIGQEMDIPVPWQHKYNIDLGKYKEAF